jgi:hypothetical protein
MLEDIIFTNTVCVCVCVCVCECARAQFWSTKSIGASTFTYSPSLFIAFLNTFRHSGYYRYHLLQHKISVFFPKDVFLGFLPGTEQTSIHFETSLTGNLCSLWHRYWIHAYYLYEFHASKRKQIRITWNALRVLVMLQQCSKPLGKPHCTIWGWSLYRHCLH